MSYNNICQTTGHRHEMLLLTGESGDGRPISQFPQNTNNQYITYQKLAQQAGTRHYGGGRYGSGRYGGGRYGGGRYGDNLPKGGHYGGSILPYNKYIFICT